MATLKAHKDLIKELGLEDSSCSNIDDTYNNFLEIIAAVFDKQYR